MAMENAKIAIFEDDDTTRELLAELLQRSNHEIVIKSCSFEESVQIIDSLKPRSIDVVLLDGNLTEGRNDSKEGSQLAQMLRKKLSTEVAIIGITGSRNPIEGANIAIDKFEIDKIREYIASL